MVVDHYIDMEDDSGHLWLRAWRCITCGDVVDSQIRQRRLLLRSRLGKVLAGRAAGRTYEMVKLSA
jgi:hypothetical protein